MGWLWYYSSRMGTGNALSRFIHGTDWRIWLGIVITVVWIVGGAWYVLQISETEPTQNFSLSAVGSFLEVLLRHWRFSGWFWGYSSSNASSQIIPRRFAGPRSNLKNRRWQSPRQK